MLGVGTKGIAGTVAQMARHSPSAARWCGPESFGLDTARLRLQIAAGTAHAPQDAPTGAGRLPSDQS